MTFVLWKLAAVFSHPLKFPMVKVLQASELPFIEVLRISTDHEFGVGANETTVWEQWMESDGFIPMHCDTEKFGNVSGTISLDRWTCHPSQRSCEYYC